MAYAPITAAQFTSTDGLDDWRVVLRTAEAHFIAPSFPAAGRLVAAIADAAEAADHHPDVSLTYPGRVRVALTTHAVDGLSTHDVDLARHISQLAADAGATAEPRRAQRVEIAIDTMDADRIRPFWAAVLDYRVQADGSLDDPRGFGAPVWFQQMDEPRTERNRFHLDVSVAQRPRRGATRGCAGRRRHAGHRRARPVVLGPRRRRGQRGLHLHLAGPRRRLSPGGGAAGATR